MKNYILIMTLLLAGRLYGQEIPLPKCCLPLNGTNSEDIMSGKMAEIYGKVCSLTDRLGAKGKAVAFDKANSYITIPVTSVDGQVRDKATLTYWMYVAKDSIAQAFWAKGSDGELLLGMKKKGMRAVLDIYHKDGRQKPLPDQQWMWSDSNFAEGEGWYFVAVTYSNDGTHFYLGTPKGKMTECYSAFAPDWNLITEICIGTVDDIPAAGMDDFKVYNAELTDDQIELLHIAEYPKGTYVKIRNKNSGKYAVVKDASLDNEALIIQHSTGIGNDEWKLMFTGLNECKIKNLHSGKLLVVRNASTSVGAEIIQYD